MLYSSVSSFCIHIFGGHKCTGIILSVAEVTTQQSSLVLLYCVTRQPSVTRILGEDSKNKREVRLLYKLVQTHLIMPTSFNYHQVYRYIFFVADLFSFMSCFVFVGSDREPVACVFSICNSTIGQCLSRLDRNKLIKQAT